MLHRRLLLVILFFNFGVTEANELDLLVRPGFSQEIDPPTISTILRDSQGLLWIGTQEGLYRFDGVALSIFGRNRFSESKLPHSYIKGVLEESNGNLLVGTLGGGLYRYDQITSSMTPLTLSSDISLRNLDFLTQAEDSTIWLATKNSIVVTDSALSKIHAKLSYENTGEDLGRLTAVAFRSKGEYLLATSTGLWETTIDPDDAGLKFHRIRHLGVEAFLYTSTSTFVTYENGLIEKVDSKNLKNVISRLWLPENVTSISSISMFNEKLWLGTDQGVLSIDPNFSIKSHLTAENSILSSNYITYLYPDQDTLWIGTFHGLYNLKQSSIGLFNQKNSSIHHEVLAFSMDYQGKLWIGTYDGLYFQEHDRSTIERVGLDDGLDLRDQRVMTLATREDELWIGFRAKGIQILDIATHSLSSPFPDELGKAEITKLLPAKNGTMWIATYNQGLYKLSNGALKKEESISEQSITILDETSSGSILAASEHRFYISHFNEEEFREVSLQYPVNAETPLLLSIAENSTGELHLGTKDQGIFSMDAISHDSGAFHLVRTSKDPKIQSSTIYGMLFDDEGKLWASTQKGIVVLNDDGSLRFRLLKQDGLQANDFNFGAAFKDSSGAMYFGGVRGYNRLDPPKLIVDYSPPKLHLVSIEVPGREYYVAGSGGLDLLELSHKDYFVNFSFSSLDFSSAGTSQYRYILEGFDPQWIDNGDRKTATYTNLPPGDYTFKVEGSNSAGVWSEESIELTVRVLPPFWRTVWAYCIYAILLYWAMWGVKRIYDNHVIKERALKLAEDMVATADRAEDDLQEQQEVQDGLVKASFRHNLELLDLIGDESGHLSGGGRSVRRHIEALKLLEACYCYQTDSLQADMHLYTEKLISRLIGGASVPAESISTVNSVTSQPVPAEVASPLALIIFELLENSLAHAFVDSGKIAHFVEITLKVSHPTGQASPHYILSVEDDGTGIPPDATVSQAGDSGLKYVQHLADKLGATFSISNDPGGCVTLMIDNCSPQQCSIE